jgi:hypothetical protein
MVHRGPDYVIRSISNEISIMNVLSKLTLFSTVLVASAIAQSAQAQVRDAAGKIQGNYNFYQRGSTQSLAAQPRAYRAPVTSAVPQAITPTQSRSFSYNATQPEPTCAAAPAATPEMPSMANRSTSENRAFSYQPTAPARRQSVVGNMPTHSGAERNAAAKVLGQY